MNANAAESPYARLESLDKRFDALIAPDTKVEKIADDLKWSEGPLWDARTKSLLFSDIPNNVIMRWDEISNTVSEFRKPSGYANGLTRDRQGRLIACEHEQRRLTRTEVDGRISVIADRFDGKPLNSPNDVVVRSDGSIWFTDPPFGIGGTYEGFPAKPELPQNLYRVDPSGTFQRPR